MLHIIMRTFTVLLLVASLCSGIALGGEGQGVGPGVQQWDFVRVREGAHMFYWLYNTWADVASPADRPLVVWLQGGPGASSTGYGNFEELGPLTVDLQARNSTWVKDVNVLFIDNPVGTGFSYVEKSSLIPTTNAQIAADLVTFTKAFLEKNPIFVDTPFYIFCESYGGKMAAEYGLELYKAAKRGDFKVNFKGVALGDGWLSPIDSVLSWGPFLLQTGMVDYEGYEEIQEYADMTREAVEAQKWVKATDLWGTTELVVESVTDYVDFYNILTKIPSWYSHKASSGNPIVDKYRRHVAARHGSRSSDEELDDLMNGHVKKALGIPEERVWGGQQSWVWSSLEGDFMRPATDVVEELLNATDISVNVFSGQLDLIVDTPGTLKWVQNLRWPGAAKWRKASRKALSVDGYIEGFVKSYDRFTFYWIERSGHMVPTDNPQAATAMLRKVTGL